MLVLTRKQGEQIQIGDGIVIKVIKSGKSTVKIGIEAPKNVRVMRAELCNQPTVKPARAEVHTSPLTAVPVSDQFPHAI